MNRSETWDARLPVDDFGNEVHWTHISTGLLFGMHGWQRSNLAAVLDNCTEV